MYYPCPSCKTRIDFPHDGSVAEVVCPGCSGTTPLSKAMRHGTLEAGTTVGGYEIQNLLGTGGMAKVYEAVQVSLQRRVALKVIVASMAGSDLMAKRFLMEVRSTASLEHPSIVTVFEASEEHGLLYLAMELVEGKTLEEICDERGGRVDEDQAWAYAEKVIRAMDYAWRYQKLLHRDIKPANVMVLTNGQVKICDLGIAKRAEDEEEVYREGIAIGTPYYMSPEQAQGKTDLDFRADVYSLGATLFHLITGHLPFPGQAALEVITKHILAETPDPKGVFPDISDAGAALISSMMRKDPDERHESWTALLEDVERVRNGDMPTHVPPSEAIPLAKNLSGRPAGYQQTIVDMAAVEQELRRTGLRMTPPETGGWTLVRMGVWLALLVVATAFLGYQFRKALFPDAFVDPQAEQVVGLQLDDGGSPLPAVFADDAGIRILDERGQYVDDVLAQLPDSPTMASITAALNRCVENGHSPITVARAAARDARTGLAAKIYNRVLMGDDSWTSEHRTQALIDLTELFSANAEHAQLPVLFNRAIAIAPRLPSPYGAVPYLLMAEHHWQALKPVLAHKILHQGIGRFLRERRTEDAATLATALLRSLEHRGDQGRLYQYCRVVLSTFPENSSVHGLAATFLKQLTPPPEIQLPVPEERMAVRFELSEAMEKLAKGVAERDVLPEIVAYYALNNEAEKVDAYLTYARKTYEGQNGEAVGRCLLALAKACDDAGRPKKALEALEKIAFGTDHGIEGRIGIEAAAQLAIRYTKDGATERMNGIVELQTTVFARFAPDTAAKRLLELAEADSANGNVTGAYRKLKRVAMGLGSDDQVTAAKDRLDHLAKTQPDALLKAKAEDPLHGPFDAIVSLAAGPASTLSVIPRKLVDGPAFAIEFWYRGTNVAGDQKAFLTLTDAAKGRLAISAGQKTLVIDQSGGKTMTCAVEGHEEWRHVALQLSDAHGIKVYVDGKPVAQDRNRPLASVRELTFARRPEGGHVIQNLVVRRGEPFEMAFTPATTLPPLSQATIALAATAFGIRDFLHNDVTVK